MAMPSDYESVFGPRELALPRALTLTVDWELPSDTRFWEAGHTQANALVRFFSMIPFIRRPPSAVLYFLSVMLPNKTFLLHLSLFHLHGTFWACWVLHLKFGLFGEGEVFL